MALASPEAIYVREVILHRNKQRAARKSFPLIKEEQIAEVITYMEQNPLIERHIQAGILYIYRELLKGTKKIIREPRPLTAAEQRQLLQLVISGERKLLKEVPTEYGIMQTVLVPANYGEIEQAQWQLLQLQRMSKNDLAA